MILVVNNEISQADLEKAKQDCGDYVKVVVDIETGQMTNGSSQKNIWGGGVDWMLK